MLDGNPSIDTDQEAQICIVCEKPFTPVREQQMCQHCINVLSLCTGG